TLQWGRARSSAEIGGGGPGGAGVRPASMGPRSIERGNFSNSARKVGSFISFNGAALDRARKCDCLGVHSLNLDTLQWGRARSSAEISARRRPSPPEVPGFNGAALDRARKSLTVGGSRALEVCFNGAALDRARKSRDRLRSVWPALPLQ